MPGHMGDRVITTQAMEIIRIDAGQNLLLVKGSVPGSDEAIVLIRRSRKGPKAKIAPPQGKKKTMAQPAGGKPAAAKPAGGAKPAAKPAAGGKK